VETSETTALKSYSDVCSLFSSSLSALLMLSSSVSSFSIILTAVSWSNLFYFHSLYLVVICTSTANGSRSPSSRLISATIRYWSAF